MRQPHFNIPPQQPFNHFQNHMPNFGYQAPPPYQRMMPPQGGFSGPNFGPGPGPRPRFDSFMETANKFLSTYQSFQPLIAQATPLFKNLPALWKLYKGFQSVPSTPRDDRKDRFNPPSPRREERLYRREDIESRTYRTREYNQNTQKPGVSLPRIYQPPFHY